MRVRARDDIHLEGLELLYAVNGGAWQTRRLAAKGASSEVEHVFALETLEDKGLVPGDVIAYYGRVRDRAKSAQTDLYFVQVRPFDRHYTQSQQSVGRGRRRSGRHLRAPAPDLGRRPGTWSMRPQAAPARVPVDLSERSALLEKLQQTLLGQTRALAERLEARGMGQRR